MVGAWGYYSSNYQEAQQVGTSPVLCTPLHVLCSPPACADVSPSPIPMRCALQVHRGQSKPQHPAAGAHPCLPTGALLSAHCGALLPVVASM